MVVVQTVIERGAQATVPLLQTRDVSSGLTPLHLAAMRGHLDVVQYLVERGADWNAKDLEGMTPVARAVASGCLDVVHFLDDAVRRSTAYLQKLDGYALILEQ